MNFGLQNKIIAVTGAASGIGLATAKMLSKLGAIVSLADVQNEELRLVEEAILKNGGKCMSMVVDVRDPEQVELWIQATVQRFGGLDGAANIAGVNRHPTMNSWTPFTEINQVQFKFLMDINFDGVWNCMQSQVKHINEGGSIVNCASVLGVIGYQYKSNYVASKHAVIGLTKAVAKETGKRQVRVNAVAPGAVETPLHLNTIDSGVETGLQIEPAESKSPLGRMATPDEIANIFVFLLSDLASYVSGSVYIADGGSSC